VKEVIKFQRKPCKIGRAAVPPILAGSAALWKLGCFQSFLAGSRGPFSSTYSFSGPDLTLSFSPSRHQRPCFSLPLSQARTTAVLCGLPPRQCRPCSRLRLFFTGHCRRLLAKPFLLFSLHSNGLEARWNHNPFRSMQCEAFSHGFQFLGGVWRI
jgi:hypothetical protein